MTSHHTVEILLERNQLLRKQLKAARETEKVLHACRGSLQMQLTKALHDRDKEVKVLSNDASLLLKALSWAGIIILILCIVTVYALTSNHHDNPNSPSSRLHTEESFFDPYSAFRQSAHRLC